MKYLVDFAIEDTGAVTVDWVVLTAGLVGLGLATIAVVSTGVEDVSTDVRDEMLSDQFITTSFETKVINEANQYNTAVYNETYTNAANFTPAEFASELQTEFNKAGDMITINNKEAADEHMARMTAYGVHMEAQDLLTAQEIQNYEDTVAEYEAAFGA